MDYRILISPAKNLKKQVFADHDRLSKPHFLKEAQTIHRALAKYKTQQLSELMGISPKLAFETKQMVKQWDHHFLYRAVELFDGEVYRGLSVDTLPNVCEEGLENRLRILSGMYGILGPNDLISPYRLEMKTKLPLKKTENLYQFWGNKIAKKLQEEAEFLVNLASDEYSKVILPFWDSSHVITPVFMEENSGAPKVVMMYAKHARGKMARFILENNIEQLSDIQAFDVDRYRFIKDLSDESRWVFLR